MLTDTLRLLPRNLPAVGTTGVLMFVPTVLIQAMGVDVERLLGGANALAVWGAFLLYYLGISAGFMRWVADGLRGEGEPTLGNAVSSGVLGGLMLGIMGLLYGCVVGVGLVLFIIPGVYLAVSMSLAAPAIIAGGYGPYAALHRSYAIVKGHRLKLLGLFVLLSAMAWLAGLLGGALSAVLSTTGTVGLWVGTVIETAGATTANSLIDILLVLAYLRLSDEKA